FISCICFCYCCRGIYYRQYQQDGFTIMSHSCTHQDMSTEVMSLQEAEYEISNSANCFGIGDSSRCSYN
ncbi:hypothetical protein ACT453_56555, partial [Bacillus sp. D-CC]